MDKTEVVRRQLGTALHLFIQDADPVSVHTLASAACEIAEHLPFKSGRAPFTNHALATFPDLDIAKLHSIQRKHFNAFKHMTTRDGKARADSELLETFTDIHNDAALFVGWYDYLEACGNEPIAAQVFQAWFFALHPEKLEEGNDPGVYTELFPALSKCSRSEQKRRLREMVELHERDEGLLRDEKTDPRPLILPMP